ncbi:MAG: amidohydrolase, partial [Oscillospiraceae bacterium]
MLIINGNVLTMAGEDYSPGFVLTRGDKIISVGPMADAPGAADEEVFDAGGFFVLPGLIDAHTHLGMFEDAVGFEGDDGNEETDPVTPQLRAVDAVNPMDRCFSEAVAAGVTAVMTGPGSANAIGGQFAAVKTAGNRIDNMILRAPACMKFALGENPKSVYHLKNQAPVTRMATAALIRETLFKAREYMMKLEKAWRDEDAEEPDFDLKLQALIPLLRKEIPAHFHAHRADDIFTAIRIAREFDIDFTIVHGTEGHLIARELARENVKLICGPALGDRSKP